MDKKTAKICGSSLVSGGAAAFGGAFVLPVMMYVLNFSDLWLMVLAFTLALVITGTFLYSLGARILKRHQIPMWKKEHSM